MYLKLRQERLKHHWTQEYVAECVGTTKQAIQLLETAKSKPSYDVLVKLENLFKLNHRQLFAVVDDTHNLSKK
jgi:transcriptional regulator with XRE-family HTH domain